MIGGKQTCGPSLGERSRRTWWKSESILSRWSLSDEFFCFCFVFVSIFSSRVVLTGARSHVLATNVCATGCVHTLTCCTHFFSGVPYTASTHRTSLCVLHTCTAQGCLQCACRHLSVFSLSPFSCVTLLCSCCSLTVTSRPSLDLDDLKAQVKRTPHEDEDWPIHALHRSWAQKSSTRILPWWHDAHQRSGPQYLRLLEKPRPRTPDNSVFPHFLNLLFRSVFMMILLFRETVRKRFWLSTCSTRFW